MQPAHPFGLLVARDLCCSASASFAQWPTPCPLRRRGQCIFLPMLISGVAVTPRRLEWCCRFPRSFGIGGGGDSGVHERRRSDARASAHRAPDDYAAAASPARAVTDGTAANGSLPFRNVVIAIALAAWIASVPWRLRGELPQRARVAAQRATRRLFPPPATSATPRHRTCFRTRSSRRRSQAHRRHRSQRRRVAPPRRAAWRRMMLARAHPVRLRGPVANQYRRLATSPMAMTKRRSARRCS